MQSKLLLEKTGCPGPIFKDWLKKQVIIPLRPGDGPGVHAEYDEANVVALTVAMCMKDAAIVVTKYAPAFQEFHGWLRSHSALEWPRQIVIFAPSVVTVAPIGHWGRATINSGFIANLEPICSEMFSSFSTNEEKQMHLLGLEAVGRK